MKIADYLEKLKAKPIRERERIAVIATGISFAVVLLIWFMSFSEMGKNESIEPASSPVSDQLEDLRSNFLKDKQSIEEMMQSLQQDSTGLENLNSLDASKMENMNESSENNISDNNSDIK